MKRKTVTLMLALICVLAAVGCNTLRGAGQDIEAVGDKVQDATD